MSATLHDFFAHPRAPSKPEAVAISIPIRASRRDVHQMAHDTLRNLYEGALAGSLIYRIGLEAMANCRGEPELAGLAMIALSNLESPPVVVALPCNCEQGDLA